MYVFKVIRFQDMVDLVYDSNQGVKNTSSKVIYTYRSTS